MKGRGFVWAAAAFALVLAYRRMARRGRRAGSKRQLPPLPHAPEFRFGVATADHQCEAYEPAGRDIRDVFEEKRCLQLRLRSTDFWNRYDEDASLAEGLGCSAFRISLSWARLEPRPGEWDDGAFEHYRAVLVALRAHRLEPFVTLHHNTWPIHVENRGGMVHPDFPVWFACYAEQVAKRLGDLISYYVTINEPNQLVFGFIKPWWSRVYAMPPGLTIGASTGTQIGKVAQLIPNLFRANALGYDAIHAVYAKHAGPNGAWTTKPHVGTNPLLLGVPPWLQRLIDRNATRLRSADDLGKQGRTLTERRLLESGDADVILAQLTLTARRTMSVEFSESYYTARLALLSREPPPSNGALREWRGRIGAVRGTTAVDAAAERFPQASIIPFDRIEDAVARLRAGRVDLVLDDDVVLNPFLEAGLLLTPIAGTEAPYAAAVAPGNRDLLNAIDGAVRAYKLRPGEGLSPWEQAVLRFGLHVSDRLPQSGRRANASAETENAPAVALPDAPTYGSSSLQNVRERKILKVAVRPGVAGLCMRTADGGYAGLEPDLARFIATRMFGDAGAAHFVEVNDAQRMGSVRSWLRLLDPLLRIFAVLSTIVTTNWWYLGLSGKLRPFLCPPECVGKLDYVGLDYYWGIRSLGFGRLAHLLAATEQRFADAPVWPTILRAMLHEHATMFPGKPIVVIENGCVDVADRIERSTYLARHIAQVQRARAEGVPVTGYLCWAITSNREWGLTFNASSDFGLYHIDLDDDFDLVRHPTDASCRYREIIASRSAA